MSLLFDLNPTLPPWLDPARVERYDLEIHSDQDAMAENGRNFLAGVTYYTVTAKAADGEVLRQWRHDHKAGARRQYLDFVYNLARRREGLPPLAPEDSGQLGFDL